MEVRTARNVRWPAPGLEFDITLQQVQFLSEFPDAAAERVEQGALAKLGHANAELPQPGGLLLEGCDFCPLPFGRIPCQQTSRVFEERLRLRTFLMREVVAVAE